MKQQDFLTRILGLWSSHPHWLKLRLRTIVGFLLALMSGLTAILMRVAWEAEGRTLLLQNARSLLQAGALTTAAIAAALATIGLLARIATVQVISRRRGRDFDSGVDLWVLLLILGIGLILPIWLADHPALSPLLRRLISLLAFVPVVGLLWLVRWQESETGHVPQPGWRELCSGIAGLASLAAFVVWGLHDIARLRGLDTLRQRLEPLLPARLRGTELMLVPWFLAVLTVLLLLLWRSLRQAQLAAAALDAAGKSTASKPVTLAPATTPGAPQTPPQNWWCRARNWLTSGSQQSAAADPASLPPDWVNTVLQHTKLATVELLRKESILPTEAAPLASAGPDNELYLTLFPPDQTPTVDQVAAVRAFDRLCNESLQAAAAAGARLEAVASADLLLAGARGAGRTSTLIACAVHAAFVRGQFVVLLVADAQREVLAVQQVQKFLVGLRLHYYLHCCSLQDAGLESWLHGSQPLPHIVVAHPESFERCWFSHQTNRHAEHVRVVRLPEVLLIDDLAAFTDQQAFHLPFLVDKQRLLLEAEGQLLQTVVGVDELSAAGRELVLERITGRRGLDADRHLLTLRPRRPADVWLISLEDPDPPRAAQQLALACLQLNRTVAVFCPGLDQTQQQRRRETLEREAGVPPGHLAVLASPEQAASGALPPELDAAIFPSDVSRNQTLALRMQHGGPGTVVFRILQTGHVPRDPRQPGLPVLTSRHAQRVAAAHFAGSLAFLRPLQPVPFSAVQRFGLRLASLPSLQSTETAVISLLELDCLPSQPGTATTGNAALPADITALGTATPEAPGTDAEHAEGLLLLPLPVKRGLFHEIWECRGMGLQLRFDPQRLRLLVCLEETADQRRLARWLEDGAALPSAAITDLAHARRLRLLLRHRTITAATVRSLNHGPMALIDAEACIGDGSDRDLPIERLSWTVEATAWSDFLGGVDDGFRWAHLPSAAAQAGQPLLVHVDLAGLASSQGELTQQALHNYQFSAAADVLLWKPAAVDPNQLAVATGTALAGTWTTAVQSPAAATGTAPDATDNAGQHQLLPELSAAVEAALRILAPGIENFLRIAAFRLTDQQPAAAVVWLLQPETGGTTAGRLVRTILRHRETRHAFLQLIRTSLEQFRKTPHNTSLPLLVATGWNVEASLHSERLQPALDLLPAAPNVAD